MLASFLSLMCVIAALYLLAYMGWLFRQNLGLYPRIYLKQLLWVYPVGIFIFPVRGFVLWALRPAIGPPPVFTSLCFLVLSMVVYGYIIEYLHSHHLPRHY